MKLGRIADRRRAVIAFMRLLLLTDNGLQRRQVRRLAAGQHIRQVGHLQQRAGTEDRLRLFDRWAGDLCTTFGRQGDHLHSRESLQHFSDPGAAYAKHLRQRLLRQFAPRRQLMLDDRGHQRLIDGFVFILQFWRGLQTMLVAH